MLEESSGSRNKDVHSSDSVFFIFDVLSTHNNACTEFVRVSKLSNHFEDLNAEFSRRDKHQSTQPIKWRPFLSVKFLNHWHEVTQSLSRASSWAKNNVASSESMGDWSTLYFCHLNEFRLEETLHRIFRDGQIRKPDLNEFLFLSFNDIPVCYSPFIELGVFVELWVSILFLFLFIFVVKSAWRWRFLLDSL